MPLDVHDGYNAVTKTHNNSTNLKEKCIYSGLFSTMLLASATTNVLLSAVAAAAPPQSGSGQQNVARHAEANAHHFLLGRHIADEFHLDKMISI